VIRTAAAPWAVPPGRGLVMGVAASLGTGVLLPFTPLAAWLGFVLLPPLFFAFLIAMTVTYLAAVEVAKRRFYAEA
jgi:Mg2+-importing ATPase